MNPEQWSYLFILPITLLFGYLKIYNETEHPCFFNCKIKIPFMGYMMFQWVISFVVVFAITEYNHPPSFACSFVYAILASLTATGIISDTEIKFHGFDLNKLKNQTDRWKNNIVKQIKKEKDSFLRELASGLTKAKTQEELRDVLLGMLEIDKFNEFEEKIENWTGKKINAYALEIVKINPEEARRLLKLKSAKS